MRAVDLGVRLLENTRVVSLTHAGAWRVATSAGEQQADVGVNGGGAWGWQVAEMVGETWPRTHFAPSMRVTARMSRFLEPVVLGIVPCAAASHARRSTILHSLARTA